MGPESASEEQIQLQRAQRLAHVGNWYKDTATGTVVWSAELYRILGLEPGSVPPSIDGIVERAVVEDRGRVLDSLRFQPGVVAQPPAIEFRIRRDDASVRTVFAEVYLEYDGDHIPWVLGTMQDVTEQRALASELAMRDRQLATLVDSGLLAMFGGRGTAVHEANDEFLRLIGRTRTELAAGEITTIMITPDEWLRVDEVKAREQYASGRAEPFEKEFLRPDGTRVPAIVGASLVDAESGSWTAFALDLSALKGTQMALAASEERYRALFFDAGVPQVVIVPGGFSSGWMALAVNQAYADFLGTTREDVLITDPQHWNLDVHLPEELDLAAAAFRGEIDSYSIEKRFRRRDGRIVWGLVSNVAIRTHTGELSHWIGQVQDITARVESEQALAVTRDLDRTLIAAISDALVETDLDSRIIRANDAFVELVGWPREEILGRVAPYPWWDQTADEVQELLAATREESHTLRRVVTRPDGTVIPVSVRVSNVLDVDGNPRSILALLHDLSQELEAVAAIEASEERYRTVVEHSPNFILRYDADLRISMANPVFTRTFAGGEDVAGLRNDELLNGAALVHDWDPVIAGVFETGRAATMPDTSVDTNAGMRYFRTRAVPEFATDINVSSVLVVATDITDLVVVEHELARQSLYDPLTGMANRVLLSDRLAHACERLERSGATVAVLFLDLDNFKAINESYAHGTGDLVLETIGARIRNALRPGDTPSRFSGDEFVVVCEDLVDATAATEIAERLREAIAVPMITPDGEVAITASVGIACADAVIDSAELLRDADTANSEAKRRGRDQVVQFTPEMHTHARDRSRIEHELRHAITHDELVLFYQPLLDFATGRMNAVEGLVRWRHPQRGLLAPGDFLPVAHESGMINAIGRIVLEKAARDLSRWERQVPIPEGFRVHVNVAPSQLADSDFVEFALSTLHAARVQPTRFCIEVTEDTLGDDVDGAWSQLDQLVDAGMTVALDDFGTGFSSLVRLKELPIGMLKIDRAFVDGVGVDHGDTSIVTAVIGLAHSLGMVAVAEGVETEAQARFLRRLECDGAQGFLYARPMDPSAIPELLRGPPILHVAY